MDINNQWLMTAFILCVLAVYGMTARKNNISNSSYPIKSKSSLSSSRRYISSPSQRTLWSSWNSRTSLKFWSSWNYRSSRESWSSRSRYRNYRSPWSSWSERQHAEQKNKQTKSRNILFGISGGFFIIFCVAACYCCGEEIDCHQKFVDDPEPDGDHVPEQSAEIHDQPQVDESRQFLTNPSLEHNDGETHAISNPSTNTRRAAHLSGIASLIDEYSATRNGPIPYASSPRGQTRHASVYSGEETPAILTPDTVGVNTPTITSLIENYIENRNQSAASNVCLGYSAVPRRRTVWSEPPDYSEVMPMATSLDNDGSIGASDDCRYPHTALTPLLQDYTVTNNRSRPSAPADTSSEETSEEDAPPSYASLFGER